MIYETMQDARVAMLNDVKEHRENIKKLVNYMENNFAKLQMPTSMIFVVISKFTILAKLIMKRSLRDF